LILTNVDALSKKTTNVDAFLLRDMHLHFQLDQSKRDSTSKRVRFFGILERISIL